MLDGDRGVIYRDLVRAVDAVKVPHAVAERRVEPYLQALAAGATRLVAPTMLTWNLTRACNLTCTYCAANAYRGRPDAAISRREAIMARILDFKPVFVSLIGGEPTLVPEIADIITEFIARGVHPEITTNGARVGPTLARRLSMLEPSSYSLMLSLDSWDAETNDSQRGRGSFATAIRAARHLAQAQVPFAIGMTIGPANLHHLLATYELAVDLGADSFCGWFVMPAGRATLADVVLPDDEFVRQAYAVLAASAVQATSVSRLDLSPSVVKWLRLAPPDEDSPMPTREVSEIASRVGCEGCRYRALVDENGDVYPCDFLQVGQFKMGNILHDDWEAIWNSRAARVKALLSRSTKPGCNTCPTLHCDTGCFGVSFAHLERTGVLLPMCEIC